MTVYVHSNDKQKEIDNSNWIKVSETVQTNRTFTSLYYINISTDIVKYIKRVIWPHKHVWHFQYDDDAHEQCNTARNVKSLPYSIVQMAAELLENGRFFLCLLNSIEIIAILIV